MLYKEQGRTITTPSKVNPNDEIIWNEEADTIPFIPPCTKNVFTKYYTKFPKSLIMWTNEDANEYLDNMKDLLKDFLP